VLDPNAESFSDKELNTEFDVLFPNGYSGPDVLQALAPEGWAASPLVKVYHPSSEQLYEESVQFHRNMMALRRPGDDRPAPPVPIRPEVAASQQAPVIEADREVRELVGRCLWDVFSDNHEVIASDGRCLDLGSFRASGGFIADLLNRQTDSSEYDYIDFYLGTAWVAQRADLGPVYRMIFHRLRNRGHDWVYHFPRLYAVDLSPLKEAMDHADKPEWAEYDPSEAIEKETVKRQREEQLTSFRESLDEGYRESVELALKSPPPAIVLAYQAVFGRDPEGWPPTRS
jgi:hypothetical protein